VWHTSQNSPLLQSVPRIWIFYGVLNINIFFGIANRVIPFFGFSSFYFAMSFCLFKCMITVVRND
jgi:hypothetical protein